MEGIKLDRVYLHYLRECWDSALPNRPVFEVVMYKTIRPTHSVLGNILDLPIPRSGLYGPVYKGSIVFSYRLPGQYGPNKEATANLGGEVPSR